MSEVDYQTALLLQHKFQQENKHGNYTDSDHKLALELHEQFQAEVEVDRPNNDLVYEHSSGNSSKCLVDPSWEVIDPTPDVHVLFMSFNERFFWNKLLAVSVSWSKRMTSCAGVCTYRGRGGLCSITLSEPLLKLRPRKDLVETLLHEMIHAFLFVTHNNKDRDGHGPEFHKHMFRINGEAGTNITVYHTFHDEVRLYQQHWWRCDGPCQKWKPYFGMVRRATNRAPGPNDRWWGEHSRSCGGNFIKVKSPEPVVKNRKAVKSTKVVSPKNDIRKYIPTSEKTNVPSKSNNIASPIVKSSKGIVKKPANTLPNKINSISSNSNGVQVTNVIPSKTSNIYGFTGLTGGTSSKTTTPKGKGTSFKGAIKNAGSSTFVVTHKGTNNSNKTNSAVDNDNNIEVFGGIGRTLGSSTSSGNDYSVVRQHWINKFDNDQSKGVKRSADDEQIPVSPKIAKSTNLFSISSKRNINEVLCPVCNKSIEENALNDHLDDCLISQEKHEKKECIICGEMISLSEYEVHVPKCTDKHFNDDALSETDGKNESNDIVDLTQSEPNQEKCPVCKAELVPADYAIHVEQCLLKMYDELDEKYNLNKSTKTSCLACNKQILKSEINCHLEDCTGMSNIFDTSNVSIVDEADEKDDMYNCPFCLRLILETEMQSHLDKCVKTNEEDTGILVHSLCSVDSDSD
ncbi:DNA-dependent metalloprotease SPRTN [Rhynchophorus ferrugineus]|uniref:DNA-dependent metalloprotease SPRTN n=1 Tax=Rhynchophorus ferrugineus TaxID=354439 RepID=UPI003FCE0358